LAYRQRIKTPRARQVELALCARDLHHWVNHWCWTFDPRLKPISVVPFDLFPKQAEFLTWLAERERLEEDGLVEKSRDAGATFLCGAYALHGWLFRPGFRCGFGSRKLELVDRKGDMKSIFEKIRFVLHNLPSWMLPTGFEWAKHDNYCRLLNPGSDTSIIGEGGDEIGRGDRTALYVVDESAYLEHPELVERSLIATTNVRIDVSTPCGPGNPFATKRFSGQVPVFTMHYRDDPRRTPEWIAKKKVETDPVTWAQEYEIDYTASIEGICIPAKWVRAAVGLKLAESKAGVVAGLDVAEFGRDRNVFISRCGPHVSMPMDWGQCNTTETAWRAAELARRAGATVVNYDPIGVGAGVTGPWQSAESGLGFEANPIIAGNTEGMDKTYWPDGKTSAQKFLNKRAEMWHKVRDRFEKSYELVTGQKQHPDEECISIPNHSQLIAELSQPLRQRTSSDKVKLESKDDMRKRGVKSPNFADALVLAFATDDGGGSYSAGGDSAFLNQPEMREILRPGRGSVFSGFPEMRSLLGEPEEDDEETATPWG
jgi:hypothetical protein